MPTPIPDTIALKTQLGQTGNSETWEVFERSKKKKLILKKIKGTFDETQIAAFQNEISLWQQLREDVPLLPDIVFSGDDGEGLW